MRKSTAFFLLLISLTSLFFLVPKAQASAEFKTEYDVRYEVKPDGKTAVIQDISLTNKLSNIYATQYSLYLNVGEVENIEAHDGEGALKIETNRQEDLTVIKLYFNQQVVGLDKTLSFRLAYDALGLAQRNGQVWDISIPRLSQDAEIDNYSLTLAVPASFGNPGFISPQPVEQKVEASLNLFRFTKSQITLSGVRAAFGQFQIFDFVLNYHLENPGLKLGEIEIALPPDTAFQTVFYQKIEPAPLNVRVDADGNWLAKYHLKPSEKLNIAAVGKVKIYAQPQEKFLLPTQEILQQDLQPQKYWEVDHPSIQTEASKLKTPEAIYRFVVKTLDYNFSRVEEGAERLGAVNALENPSQAICTEFTDLFVALSRAAGIPAREINGYAYTTNEKLRPLSLVSDILHAWPEYWDEKQKVWLPVDPTWEKTTKGIDHFSKTDLNHFTFAIHGQDSENPFPAGSYKTDDISGRDVQIAFGKYEVEDLPNYEVDFDLPKTAFFGIGNRGKIIIKNIGKRAGYNLEVGLETKNLNLTSPGSPKIILPVLPPYAQEEISLQLKPTGWGGQEPGLVKVTVDGKEYSSLVNVASILNELATPLFSFCVLAIGTIIMLKIGRRLKDAG